MIGRCCREASVDRQLLPRPGTSQQYLVTEQTGDRRRQVRERERISALGSESGIRLQYFQFVNKMRSLSALICLFLLVAGPAAAFWGESE